MERIMSPSKLVVPPPMHEVFNQVKLVERHPDHLTRSRVAWAVRNREDNGLDELGAVFESPCGELLIHEPAFLRWYLGLTGRGKPRALRRRKAFVGGA
jgi:hypothetical protein